MECRKIKTEIITLTNNNKTRKAIINGKIQFITFTVGKTRVSKSGLVFMSFMSDWLIKWVDKL